METLKFSTEPLRIPHFQNHFSKNPRILGVYNSKGHIFSFTLTCKLKTSKRKKNNKKKIAPGKFSVPDSGDEAPPPLERKKAVGKRLLASNSVDGKVSLKKVLSNLPLAIGEMFTVAGLMALGTIIEQGEVPNIYLQNFPEYHPLSEFFSWKWIFTLSLDQMFYSPIFLGTLALLSASLMACTRTTRVPLVKVAKRRSFLNSSEATHKQEHADQQTRKQENADQRTRKQEHADQQTLKQEHADQHTRKQEHADTLPRASVKDMGVTLMGAGYEEFLEGPALYAFKELAGRFSRIGVHLALLLVMSGGNLGAAGSFSRDATVPQGLDFFAGEVRAPSGVQSTPSGASSSEVHVNRFHMDYNESGKVSQFHTDLSLLDLNGKEVLRKTMSVNDPSRYSGIIIYPTDRSISALQILKNEEGSFNVATIPLKMKGEKNLIVTVGDDNSTNAKGISMQAGDMQSVMLYGTKIIIVEGVSNSGLDLKGEFPDTVDRLLDQVAELVESSSIDF